MPTFTTPDPIVVEVRNSAGSVVVDLVDTPVTSVEVVAAGHPFGFLSDLFDSLPRNRSRSEVGGWQAQPSGDGHHPDVRIDWKPGDGPGAGVLIVDTDPARSPFAGTFDVRISAPAHSSVRARTASSALAVSGAADRVEGTTASGAVRLDQVSGDAVIRTASGNVYVARAAADLRCNTASGDIQIDEVGGPTRLHTASGDVSVGRAGGDVEVRTVSGDIRLASTSRGSAELAAISGDVEVGVAAGRLAQVDLMTVSGRTRTDFPVRDGAGVTGPASPVQTPGSTGRSGLDAPADEMIGADESGAPIDAAVPGDTDLSGGRPAQPADEPALRIRVRTTSGDIWMRRAG